MVNKNKIIYVNKPSFEKYKRNIESSSPEVRKQLYFIQEEQKEAYNIQEAQIKAGIKPSKFKSTINGIASSILSGPGFTPTKPRTFDLTYSREQRLLQDMFGGNPVLTDDEFNPPVLNGVMRKGGGILKTGDPNRSTARMFGLFR